MNIQNKIKLIEKIFNSEILFESVNNIGNYRTFMCENYDDLNLYICKKRLGEKIDPIKYIKQLSLSSIRNTLFNSYLEINKINEEDMNNWTEKIIYDKRNYNIQKFKKENNLLLCYSNLDLDDDSFEYVWINNPYTLVIIENKTIYLKIAFETNNNYQNEILKNFVNCLDKLEKALGGD